MNLNHILKHNFFFQLKVTGYYIQMKLKMSDYIFIYFRPEGLIEGLRPEWELQIKFLCFCDDITGLTFQTDGKLLYLFNGTFKCAIEKI